MSRLKRGAKGERKIQHGGENTQGSTTYRKTTDVNFLRRGADIYCQSDEETEKSHWTSLENAMLVKTSDYKDHQSGKNAVYSGEKWRPRKAKIAREGNTRQGDLRRRREKSQENAFPGGKTVHTKYIGGYSPGNGGGGEKGSINQKLEKRIN